MTAPAAPVSRGGRTQPAGSAALFAAALPPLVTGASSAAGSAWRSVQSRLLQRCGTENMRTVTQPAGFLPVTVLPASPSLCFLSPAAPDSSATERQRTSGPPAPAPAGAATRQAPPRRHSARPPERAAVSGLTRGAAEPPVTPRLPRGPAAPRQSPPPAAGPGEARRGGSARRPRPAGAAVRAGGERGGRCGAPAALGPRRGPRRVNGW